MKSRLRHVFSIVLCFCLTASLSPFMFSRADASEANSVASIKKASYVSDEVIVSYKQDVASTVSLSAECEASEVLRVDQPITKLTNNSQVYKLKDGVSVEEAIKELNSDERVEYAEPNYIVELTESTSQLSSFYTNDPLAEANQWSLTDKNADIRQAWDEVKTEHKVGVAVIDSGVNYNHPDLKNNVKNAVSLVSREDDKAENYGSGDDVEGHGTHVCGIISAQSNNSIGISGVSYNADILSIRVFYKTSSGKVTSTAADVIRGIDYAVEHRSEYNIKVINMSLEFTNQGVESQIVSDSVDRAWDAGILCCVASGNESVENELSPTGFPASLSKCLAVGSINKNHTRSSFSNGDENLDVVAPGESIYSTVKNGGYESKSGTSMSTPYVAAVAALMWANNTKLTPLQVSNAIKSTAIDLGSAGKDNEYGWGQVNPFRAIDATQPTGKVSVRSVYRLYNPSTGEHFYTIDTTEKNTIVSLGWRDEGTGWKSPRTSLTPVYRLYNPNAGDHHYTTDFNEYIKLASLGWRKEGIAFYSEEKTKGVSVLRAYNPNARSGAHNFTTDSSEQNYIVKLGWRNEGVAWYSVK